MTLHYGIDTSIFIRLLTASPKPQYLKTLEALNLMLESEPRTKFVVSNQVIGEAYITLQHHFKISKVEARRGIHELLTCGLLYPLNGESVLRALTITSGCGLMDRLIVDGYQSEGLMTLTLDKRMSRLEDAQRL